MHKITEKSWKHAILRDLYPPTPAWPQGVWGEDKDTLFEIARRCNNRKVLSDSTG